MARKKLIVGNWKMHFNVPDSSMYAHKLSELIKVYRDVEVVVAPTMLAVQTLSLQVNYRQIKLAAQNFYHKDSGSYTGEVSANMLRGMVNYGIVGHFERRNIFMESDKEVRKKVEAAIRNHIKPIICVGETLQERMDNETKAVLHDQVYSSLVDVTKEDLKNIVIAYEPVWAIGTGEHASAEDVKRSVRIIRSLIRTLFGQEAASDVRILYGGSVNLSNADVYLNVDNVDGLLIGGASLDAYQFSGIVEKAHFMQLEEMKRRIDERL